MKIYMATAALQDQQYALQLAGRKTRLLSYHYIKDPSLIPQLVVDGCFGPWKSKGGKFYEDLFISKSSA